MKRERDHHVEDLSGRIKSLDMFTGSLVARSQPEPVDEAVPVHEPAPLRVPVPRRSRVFLRHGAGAFADLTLTTPRPRAAVD